MVCVGNTLWDKIEKVLPGIPREKRFRSEFVLSEFEGFADGVDAGEEEARELGKSGDFIH